jgi:hypothetical protein
MEEALRFFRTYELWIYLLLALGGIVYVRKFILAWDELRGAAFGLERESAQARINHSASMLVLLLVMAIAEFSLVTFVAPSFPGANPLLTPTLDLLATPTTTLPAEQASLGPEQELAPTTTLPPVAPLQGEGCLPGQVELAEPMDGKEVIGVVTLMGTVKSENFGFYKYEVARPGDPLWLTIQAGRDIVEDGELGQWDTRSLQNGDYQLRLVVTDNQGETLPPCIIQVRINNPAGP